MKNQCDYKMRVSGEPESIRELIKIIKRDTFSKSGKHLFDVFTVRLPSKKEINTGVVTISGYCSWSVFMCMMPGENSYFMREKKQKAITYGTTIQIQSCALNLDIEVYSSNSHLCFEEHVLIKQGIIVIDDKREMYQRISTLNYKTAAEMTKAIGFPVTQEYFEVNDFIRVGGFDEWDYAI